MKAARKKIYKVRIMYNSIHVREAVKRSFDIQANKFLIIDLLDFFSKILG